MSALSLEFENLSGGYGAMTIVRDLSAKLSPGECLCVLGRNGVGKSTLIKLLSGHLPSMQGRIAIDGTDVGQLSPDKRRGCGLSYAMQERPIFDNLSVGDNLMLMQPQGSQEVYAPFFQAFPVLDKRRNQMAGTLSGGERKILSFVRAMAEEGSVTLLDEPSEGVQPENIEHMKQFILSAKNAGRSFVVVEQHLHLAEEIADTYLVVDHGRAVLQGEASRFGRAELLKHIEV